MQALIRKSWVAPIAPLLLVAALVFGTGSVPTAAALGSEDCGPNEQWTKHGDCVEVDTSKYGGELPTGGGVTTIPVIKARGGEPPRCFQDVGTGRREVDCVTDHGWWNGTCYVQQVTDPPRGERAAFEDAKKGHDGGVVIGCYYLVCDDPEQWRNDPDAYLLQCPTYTWAPDAEPVDPAAIAEEIWASLSKRAIDIGVAPYDKPDHAGYVGLGTWYWVQDPDEHTIGPLGASDNSHGFTVVAESRVQSIEFDLGNDVVLDCPPNSMPFEEGKGLARQYPQGSPDCGHVFTETGTYDIVARTQWIETWEGLGQSGSREFELESPPATIRIAENQALRQ